MLVVTSVLPCIQGAYKCQTSIRLILTHSCSCTPSQQISGIVVLLSRAIPNGHITFPYYFASVPFHHQSGKAVKPGTPTILPRRTTQIRIKRTIQFGISSKCGRTIASSNKLKAGFIPGKPGIHLPSTIAPALHPASMPPRISTSWIACQTRLSCRVFNK